MLKAIDRITLALPAYNEAACLSALLRRARTALNRIGLPWDIVVVDDGSTDETAAIADGAAESNPHIHVIRHDGNRGLGPAIVTGLQRALEFSAEPGALIVTMDADLTHSPDVIESMIRAAEEGADLVIASRFQPGSTQQGVNAFRRLLSFGARQVFRWGIGLPGVRDYTCGFRAVRASWVARGFEHYGREGLIVRRGFACTDEVLIKLALLGLVIREVPFDLRYDLKRGASKIPLGVTIVETVALVRWARREMRRR